MLGISYLIFGLLFVGVGLGIVLIGQRRLQGRIGTAQGTVVGIEVSYKVNKRGQPETLSRPVVTYTVAGRTFTSPAAEYTNHEDFTIGDSITVRFNPHEPGTIVVHTSFSTLAICSFALGIFLLLMFFIH